MNQPIEASLTNPIPAANDTDANNPKRRAVLFALLALTVTRPEAAAYVYWELVGSRYVSTDNAYTAAEVAMVTAEIDGPVAEVRVVDSQKVKRGDILVVIDDTDAKTGAAPGGGGPCPRPGASRVGEGQPGAVRHRSQAARSAGRLGIRFR